MAVNRTTMPIRVDRNSPVPLYFQVAQHLEHMIESGDLATGTRLENETDLAGQLGLSRQTMRRAIGYLVDRGLLVRKRGVGTQVVHAKVRRQVELTSLYDDLAKTRRNPRTQVLSFAIEPVPDAVALELGLEEGTPAYVFRRLRYAEGEPPALMTTSVPASLLRLSAEDLGVQGLYSLLRANGINLRIAKQSIGARASTAAEARALGETRGTPLLTMERAAYEIQCRPPPARLVSPPLAPRRLVSGQVMSIPAAAAAAVRFSAASRRPSIWSSSASSCSMLTAMPGSTALSARRNRAQNSWSWPRPTATNCQEASAGHRFSVFRPPIARGFSSAGTRWKRSSSTP